MPKKKKQKSGLNEALAKIEKQFGKGAIMRLEEDNKADIPAIPTGSIELDMALGVGGIPRGRIIEVYGTESSGKTTLCLSLIKQAQKQEGRAVFIDAEHAFDYEYAKKIGIDIPELIISQPDSGEQALEIAQALIESEEVDLIVIDSVASLTPKAEVEGEMSDAQIGLQARLMSKACRKLTAAINRTNTCVVFINQIREKIGVMFGCLHYNARVLLANGETEKIGKIVNQKKDIEVLSYNNNTKIIEPKFIKSWFKNGKAKQMYQMIVQNPHKAGKSRIPIADNHLIPTPNGEKYFKDLKVGDKVYIKVPKYLNEFQNQIAIGMILGDSSLKTKNNLTCSIRTKHGTKQNEYCKFKYTLFPKEFISCKGKDSKGRFYFESKYNSELMKFKKYKSKGALRYLDNEICNKITKPSIAIWYLDDGNFSGTYKFWGYGKSMIYATKLNQKSKELLVKRFVELGLPKPIINEKGFIFYGKDSFEFQKEILTYIPSCMKHKIHPKLRNKIKPLDNLEKNQIKEILFSTQILNIYKKKNYDSKYKFDLEIKDNHNYFIDDVLVHNSPETTPGGRALKFYASVRIDLRRIATLKQGDTCVGTRVKAKIAKNKVAPPFRVAEFEIYFDEGLSSSGDILNLAIKHGIIDQKGAWFSYKGKNIGQGQENTRQYLKQNEKILTEIKAQICNLLGIKCSQKKSKDK